MMKKPLFSIVCMHASKWITTQKKEEDKKLTLCLGLIPIWAITARPQPKKVWNKDLQKKTWNLNIYKALTNQALTSYNDELYFYQRKKMSSR
jgi:hypothetical protein